MSDTLILLFQLFGVFFVIGLFTFGGGYAMLSLIQTQVVTAHGWIAESTFADIVAISQMTPGPIGINCATYVGYDVLSGTTGSHILGIIGSATATFAISLPSFILVLLIVRFYTRFRSNSLFEGVMKGLRPAVVGLIGAAAILLMFKTVWSGTPLLSIPEISVVKDNLPDWKSWILLVAGFAASYWGKVSPILLILAGAAAGLLLY